MIVKRDLELLRRLLLSIEESDDIPVHPNQLTNLCSDQNLLNYHIYLLYEAGFIHAIEVDVMGSYIPQYRILYLSNSGYDYLDSVRNVTIWNKVKSCLSSVGGNVALDIVQQLAEKFIIQSLTNRLLP